MATLPINVLIYLKLSYPSEESAVSLDWGGLFTSLAVVVAGILGGLILGQKKPAWRSRLNVAGNAAGVSLVLLGFFFSSNSSAPIWARTESFYAGVAGAASHLFWQIRTVDLDDPEDCAAKFRSNATYGGAVFLSAGAGKAFA